jgi:hypothetical protein
VRCGQNVLFMDRLTPAPLLPCDTAIVQGKKMARGVLVLLVASVRSCSLRPLGASFAGAHLAEASTLTSQQRCTLLACHKATIAVS